MNIIDTLLVKLLGSTGFTVITASLGGLLTLLFGTWTPLMAAVLIVQVTDIVTGMLAGSKKRELSSETFFDGLKKKVGMWCLLIIANVMDTHLLGGMPVCKSAVSAFLLAGEGLSVTENLALIGVPVPAFITKYLQQVREDNSKVDLPENEGDDSDKV